MSCLSFGVLREFKINGVVLKRANKELSTRLVAAPIHRNLNFLESSYRWNCVWLTGRATNLFESLNTHDLWEVANSPYPKILVILNSYLTTKYFFHF